MSNFFISYSHKDAVIANKIRNHILKLNAGHDVFLDIKSLSIGVNWKKELKRKIESADFVIFIVSKHSIKSKYVKKELAWIRKSKLNTGIRKLLSFRIDSTEIIEPLSDYQVLDATENFTIDFYNIMAGANIANSFYDIEYKLSVIDELHYKLECWIEVPIEFLSKIQMAEYRFDYMGNDKGERIVTKANTIANLKSKFKITSVIKYHLTLFVMLYLYNTKELCFIKRIHLSH